MLGFSDCAFHPDCLYMFVFWLKWNPLKKKKNPAKIESAFIRQSLRMIPFQRKLKMGLFVVLGILSSL